MCARSMFTRLTLDFADSYRRWFTCIRVTYVSTSRVLLVFLALLFLFLFLLFLLLLLFFFFSSRRRHTRYIGDWSSDVCSSDL